MATVTLSKRGRSSGRKLKLNGKCFVFAAIIIVTFMFLNLFYLESHPNENLSPQVGTNNQILWAPQKDPGRLRQSPIKSRGNPVESEKSLGPDRVKVAEDVQDWTLSARDGLEDLSNYGIDALTGSHVFRDGPACETRKGIPCMIHFPWVDLKNVIDHDEALDVDPMDRFLHPGGSEPTNVDNKNMVFPEPKYTNHLLKQPPSLLSDQHALLTRCGCKFRASGVSSNQDRAVLVSPFHNDNDGSHDFVMGIFDGHGGPGHVVSHYSALELPRVLSHQLNQHGVSLDTSVKQALTNTFLKIDEDLPIVPSGGSTASVILRLDQKLYVANTGDSQSFIATYNVANDSATIVYRNGLHKPANPEERERIEGQGGEVIMPQGPGDSSRVLVRLDQEFMALAMSRSIGDREAKEVGVIADPTIDVLHLSKIATPDVQVFAVTASDGLFDRVEPDVVALHLARSLYRSDSPPPLQACEQLIMKSSEMWIANSMPYRDDITIAVTKVVL